MKSCRATIPIKAFEQYFRVVLCIMMYKVVLTFNSSMGSYIKKVTVISCATVCFAKQI